MDELENITPLEEEEIVKQDLDDALKQIKEYLTKEELLYIAVYKNSYKPRNSIYRVFIEKYRKKTVGLSTISMQKKRIFRLLEHLNRFIKFKNENSMDLILKEILTVKQYRILMLYERRKTVSEMMAELKIKKFATHLCMRRALARLSDAKNPQVETYLRLLKNVLKFSRKNRSILPVV